MTFAKVDSQVDFPALERTILKHWADTDAFETLRKQNANGPKWSFLDGPITANNPMGVHHAWGRTYKDAFQRYHGMRGRHLRYQNGFDCQGLWVEVEVEKELKLRSKRDIENLVPGDKFASIDKFVNLCKERVDRFAKVQTEQSIRLGYWMDWDKEEDWAKKPDDRRSYFTMSEVNNTTIWTYLKKCHDRGLVYRGYDAMPWCPRCSVGLSQMEMAEGYQMVAHRAPFVKFALRDEENAFLLVWTTTPWTLSSNVAAAVNPELTYLRIKHRDQIYYLAKGAYTAKRLDEEFKRKEWLEGVPRLKTLEQMFKEKGGAEILGELKGSEMLGWAYDGPWDELEAQTTAGGFPNELVRVATQRGYATTQSAKEAHRVIAWKEVGETEGTGIVHIAPGCGREDFLLGQGEKLPGIAPLDEFGCFLPGFGILEGKNASETATTDFILETLTAKGVLFATEKYPHKYPHCWRCKTEVLFRLVEEWFIGMSWRDEIMKVCGDIQWIPAFGHQRELDWLKNMGDWMISKKRFWGLALPVWIDEETDDFEVIGSREELEARAVEGIEHIQGRSLHKPWIDMVKIRNPKTGNLMTRIPDVGNPWLDAGIVPFSTMGYNADPKEWESWFPADLITECFPGQFRNWFYALLAMSTMMVGRAPFKTLLGHALVRDQNGDEMHKSKGNSIPFEGASDHGYALAGKQGKIENHPPMGADLVRWMYCRQNPAQNINFGPSVAEEVRARFFLKLWNTYSFFCNYARLDGYDPSITIVSHDCLTDLDRWILSDLQKLVQTANDAYLGYDLAKLCAEVESFVDDKVSNWYVRRNRRRFWKAGAGTDKSAAYQTLHQVLVTVTRICAPIIPFFTDALHQNLCPHGRSSIHLESFPQPDHNLIDEELSAQINALLKIVSMGLSARNGLKIKVRQPLAEFRVQCSNDTERAAVLRFVDQITEELNVKKVTIHDHKAGSLLLATVKANIRTLGPKLGAKLAATQRAILAADPLALAAKAAGGVPFGFEVEGETLELSPEDLAVELKAPEGFGGVGDRETQVALDGRITRELALEGQSRDIVRNIQELRKKANLQLEDRIDLHLNSTAADLIEAIRLHGETIAGETLTTSWAKTAHGEGGHEAEVKIEGHFLLISLRKV